MEDDAVLAVERLTTAEGRHGAHLLDEREKRAQPRRRGSNGEADTAHTHATKSSVRPTPPPPTPRPRLLSPPLTCAWWVSVRRALRARQHAYRGGAEHHQEAAHRHAHAHQRPGHRGAAALLSRRLSTPHSQANDKGSTAAPSSLLRVLRYTLTLTPRAPAGGWHSNSHGCGVGWAGAGALLYPLSC